MRVEFKGITKKFGPLKAIDDVSLTVEEGDFFTLLGPSGCGKTTLLRTVAGFYTPDAGEILFGTRRINDVPAHRRETGMVFQNYALFPHMNVFENVAYGLKVRRLPAATVSARVHEILARVQLDGLERRAPSQLSGGQQQRVALARALVISPQVLLMDEPLSNLDAKLRVGMREEIKRIQREFKTTTIYVTHDQEEAMAISDRIAIMNRGRLERIGTPLEIYLRPNSRFVAEFMGSSNILEGRVAAYDPGASLLRAEVHGETLVLQAPEPAQREIGIAIRPEWIRLFEHPPAGAVNLFPGEILSASFLGSIMRYRLSGLGQVMLVEVLDPQQAGVWREGARVFFAIDPARPVILTS